MTAHPTASASVSDASSALADTTDPRLQALHRWLCSVSGAFSLDMANWAPASADASFRRYFRIGSHDPAHPSLIVMDAPPPQEDCRPFVHIAGLLAEAGLQAPKVLAEDLAQGFLLLTDLGRETYLDVLNDDNARPLMRAALDALIVWQQSSRPDVLPAYDTALLQRELDLFPDWYVGKHLKVELNDTQRATLDRVNQLLIENALAQPKVFVHRDYMPRNLMPGLPGTTGPGILDFQDAVYGPLTYDVISLMRDAFLSWDEERQLDWLAYYWERARKAGLPVDADFGEFYRQAEWMGLQRHLKVLGIFARINYRDGKPRYLADTPRFLDYARKVADRYAPLRPLAKLLDELTGQRVDVGYTF
ncbi:aminoglycoside phosphotransferase family protein [Pandoraea anhela]|uniref:Aminoglycoside phosphotransferase n=1 Tax=Pandoraea anhela TaxID=2508295 RepID=A0A5E4XUT1_9BURK|nr:phosphotransferase [Pandoraea anhela]VVE40023.1 aminoglycoside phosphotransferase [Pandoraea anhela]